VTSVADYFRKAKCLGARDWGNGVRRILCLCRKCWRRCLSNRPIHCSGEGSFQDRGVARRQPPGPESLLITPGATGAPRWLIFDRLLLLAISSTAVRVTGTRELTRVPEET
jgi:hypothetical protein